MHNIVIASKQILQKDTVSSFFRRQYFDIQNVDADTREILSAACTTQPDLIIFPDDIKGMSAAELCRTIKTDPLLQCVQLLMITEQSENHLNCFAQAQTDAHLIEPVEDQRLLETIGTLLKIGIRGAIRVPVSILALAENLATKQEDELSIAVNVVNLSETGMLLESPVYLSVGASGRVLFALPDRAEKFSLDCIVRVLTNEVLLHYGIEFMNMDHGDRVSLRNYIEHLIGS